MTELQRNGVFQVVMWLDSASGWRAHVQWFSDLREESSQETVTDVDAIDRALQSWLAEVLDHGET